MVTSHELCGVSWWSPYAVPRNYIFFAALYGLTKLFCGISKLSEVAYAIEALFFMFNGWPITAIICGVIAYTIYIKRERHRTPSKR